MLYKWEWITDIFDEKINLKEKLYIYIFDIFLNFEYIFLVVLKIVFYLEKERILAGKSREKIIKFTKERKISWKK